MPDITSDDNIQFPLHAIDVSCLVLILRNAQKIGKRGNQTIDKNYVNKEIEKRIGKL